MKASATWSTLLVLAGLMSANAQALTLGFYDYVLEPWDYPAPIIVAPSPVMVLPPAIYVEQPQGIATPVEYWSYCPSSKTYYPYVQQCSMPWQSVAPQSAPEPRPGE